jgi:hypothetical protein
MPTDLAHRPPCHRRAGILNINVDGWTDDISGTCPVNGAKITTETITASGPGLEVTHASLACQQIPHSQPDSI